MQTKASPQPLNVLVWVAHHLEADSIIHDYVERVTEVFSSHNVRIVQGPEAWRGNMHGVDVLVAWTFNPEILTEADCLKWVQFGSAGINHALSPQLLESGVRLTTLRGVHPEAASEHAIAMMLAWCRRLHLSRDHQAAAQWVRNPFTPHFRQFAGSTVGVIGMGGIGRAIARKCRLLGARVIATRSSTAQAQEADQFVERDCLGPLLEQSHWVVLAVPDTGATRRLIASGQIAQMRSDAVLVNIARGTLVDESALAEALQQGRIAGACLDVFETEPLPEGSPLWAMPEVIITPHTAGATPDYGRLGAAIVQQNLKAFLAGDSMPTQYDPARGY